MLSSQVLAELGQSKAVAFDQIDKVCRNASLYKGFRMPSCYDLASIRTKCNAE